MIKLQTRSSQPAHARRWGLAMFGLAAIAVTGGVGVATATSPDGAAAYVPINPCRLADTRAGSTNIGDRNTPLGADGVMTLDGRGEHGNCSGPAALPANATGLQLNVTAINATKATFLTLYPAGTERPTASHLNPTAGAPALPNAVTVKLADDGRFNVFNRFGTVDVIVDVVGFYADHNHDDRYYTRTEVDALVGGAGEWEVDVPAYAMRVVANVQEAAIYKTIPGDEGGLLSAMFKLPAEYQAGTDLSVATVVNVAAPTADCAAQAMILGGGVLQVSPDSSEATLGSMEFVAPTDPGTPTELVMSFTQYAPAPGTPPYHVITIETTVDGTALQPGDWVEVSMMMAPAVDATPCALLVPFGMTVRPG